MSFTAKLKEEILEKNSNKPCCLAAELAGILAFSSSIYDGYIKITLESKNVARKIIKLLKKVADIQAGIEVKPGGGVRKKDIFIITVKEYNKLFEFLGLKEGETVKFPGEITQNECCKKAFIKGAFLGGGSVADPSKRYHLEFVTPYKNVAEGYASCIGGFGIKAGVCLRRGKYVVYFKECDAICDCLTMAGVMNGTLEIYEIKVIKDKKNEVNRLNNSEIANIIKVADASAAQRHAIEKIRDSVGLDALPEALKALAKARLEYPEDGLLQLGARLSPPIGKSGVNHRMRKIMEISKRY
jgi:DNA-binding protein WhiA